MKDIFKTVVCIVAVAALAACGKEPVGGLRLVAEGMDGGNKLSVNGAAAAWATGDEVLINGETVTVTVANGDATATSSAGGFEAPYTGVYPANIYSSNSGSSYVLSLPEGYVYAVDANGRQNLASPMVAYAASGSTLFFKHLTAAIAVEVVNNYGFTVNVDSIKVISDSYRLHGSVSLTIDGGEPSVDPAPSSNLAERTLTMRFTGSDSLKICAGDRAEVQVPVLPVGSGNHFTINVYVHKVGQAAVAKTLTKTQNAGGTLGRNVLAYARLATPGLFSVSATQKVVISQGNLQYQASNGGTWRFAPEQYMAIGNAAGNNNFGDDRSTQADWIDLFGWGTSGYDGASAYATSYYRPWDYIGSSPSNHGYCYGPNKKYGNDYDYTYSLVGDFAECDWGVHNAISNGGGVSGRWRTLTGGSGSEWEYLFSTRSASTVGSTANARYEKVHMSVGGNDIYGVILFPDVFAVPDGVTIPISKINVPNAEWGSVGILNLDELHIIEAEGAVFLPCTGYRKYASNNQPQYTGDKGYYWSSTYRNVPNAYCISITGSVSSFNDITERRYGCFVRLVRNAQ